MQKTHLDKRNLSVNKFKSKYPRLYNRIIFFYGGRKNIFDMHAAIQLYLSNQQPPKCDVCGKLLTITKKMRYETANRCHTHANLKNVVKKNEIEDHAKELEVEIVGELPEYPVKSHTISLRCRIHGEYSQRIGYFLSGGQCQKCYHESRSPRITQKEWIDRCNQIHNSFYDYSQSNFQGIAEDITIICPIHGIFKQNAGVHQRGHGCGKCSNAKIIESIRMTTPQFIEKATMIHDGFYNYSKTNYLACRDKITITCPKHGDFEQVPYYHLAGNGCPQCGFEKCNTNFQSDPEIEIYEWLKSIDEKMPIKQNDRSMGKEIDIYLPDIKLGIEYNGLYWHSSNNRIDDYKKKNQHKDKTIFFQNLGIQLLQIMEHEWLDPVKQNTWKSTILHKLKKTPNIIGARKCKIERLYVDLAKKFFTENHLQGNAQAQTVYGLLYNDEVLAAISVAPARFQHDKQNQIEIIRYATKNFYHIPGGFSKLLSAIKEIYSDCRIISFANLRWSDGDLYSQNQFSLVGYSEPCYYYTNNKSVWHRSYFQKHKLSTRLDNFDPEKTEVDNMYANGYRRFWDCGNIKYEC